jgi:O-antigen/teichoic acid export membrane protein
VKDLKEAARSNTWYWFQSVISLLGYLSDKFLVAWLTDLETLGYYSIASLIAIQVHNVLLAFGSFIFPRVSHGSEMSADTRPIYYGSRMAIALPGWIILISLWLLGPFILPLWLGETTYLNAAPYINLYIAFEAIILLIIVPYHFLNGTEHVKLNTGFEAALRSSHIILMLGFYALAGPTGLIIGLIVATLLNLPFQYYYFEYRVFGNRSLKNALPVLPAALIAGAMISTSTLSSALFVLFLIATTLIYIAPVVQQLRRWSQAAG